MPHLYQTRVPLQNAVTVSYNYSFWVVWMHFSLLGTMLFILFYWLCWNHTKWSKRFPTGTFIFWLLFKAWRGVWRHVMGLLSVFFFIAFFWFFVFLCHSKMLDVVVMEVELNLQCALSVSLLFKVKDDDVCFFTCFIFVETCSALSIKSSSCFA